MRPAIKHNRTLSDFVQATTLREMLTAPVTRAFDRRMLFWLGLSLVCSAYFASEGLRQAFSSQYVVQDDARQHVFWMERFVDGGLFPKDLSADYFQAMAPYGYTGLYGLMALLKVDPLLLNKLLPSVLGLVATAYCFGLCFQILRVPTAAFISALLLNQSLWMQDDLVSATPRAFLYPLLLAFLYYLSRGSWVLCFAALALEGLFYPSVAFISVGILVVRLLVWRGGRARFSRVRRDYVFCAIGLAIVGVVLCIYAVKSSGFGPVVTASEARAMAEFSPKGRMRVFHEGFWEYWVSGTNTGMIPAASLMPVTICSAVLLPILLRYRNRFPLTNQISTNVRLLPQLAFASVLMFFAAHLLMFKLYLPNRYTQHSVRIILCVGAGLALTIILDSVLRFCEQPFFGRQVLALASIALLAFPLILFPGSPRKFMRANYRTGGEPRLYAFFSQQPKDILIASLSHESSKIPVFAKRSTLVSWESSIPFHKRYYSQMRQRAVDLINGQYSPDLSELQSVIQKYQIDFLLVDRRAFDPEYLASDKWILLYQPAADDAIARLRRGIMPALARLTDQCTVEQTEDHIVVAADCILKAPLASQGKPTEPGLARPVNEAPALPTKRPRT